MKIEVNVEMGWKMKDLITGLEGIVVGFCSYITGCHRVCLSLPLDKDGKRQDAEWFDVQRIERVGNSQLILENEEAPGFGPEAPIK